VVKRRHYRRVDEEKVLYLNAVAAVRPHQFIFLDEMHLSRREALQFRGWGLKGSRVVANGITAGGRRHHVTAAMDLEGMLCWDICVVDDRAQPQQGAIAALYDRGNNTAWKFQNFIYYVLGPYIRARPDMHYDVVMDNASVQSVPHL